MTDSTVLFEARANVALITLNRPTALNSFTRAMHHDLWAALDLAEADPTIRACVITGAGRGFCAGADLGDFDFSPGPDMAKRANPFVWVKPKRPAQPDDIWEVPGRMDPSGRIVQDLDEDAVRASAREIVQQGVRTVAVVLLNSYANADHERRVGEILRADHPGLQVFQGLGLRGLQQFVREKGLGRVHVETVGAGGALEVKILEATREIRPRLV